jgi:leucyl aminopeptidase (aminopeptidase T)
MEQGRMFSAAFNALKEVMEISSVDKVLILNDIHSQSVSNAFSEASRYAGCETVFYLINEKERPLKEIPPALSDLLPGKTIVLNILKALPEEINFRIKWLFKIEQDKKARCAHMPGITEAMMTEGPMNVNYKDMRKRASLLMAALKDADYLYISTKSGTNLVLGIRDRIFTDDVFVNPGGMCNLPCGEIYCAPEETRADGVIIFDASIGDIGLLENPLSVSVKGGKISLFASADKKLVERITELSSIDEEAKEIGELGIGINPGARITGNMLEDEKAIHTAHIAFGNNEDFPGGGKNHSKIHRDFLFHKPDIEIFYKNNSHRLLVKRGEFLI